jgi:hypothetical protein
MIDDVHLREPLGSVRYRGGDRREGLAGFLDDYARIVHDTPSPAGVRRGRNGAHLHDRPALASARADARHQRSVRGFDSSNPESPVDRIVS